LSRPGRPPTAVVGLAASLVALISLVAACGDEPSPGEQQATRTTPPPSAPASITLRALDVPVDFPTDATALPGGSLLVTEKAGRVKELVADGKGDYTVAGTVADVTSAVGSPDSEQGLLGVTTNPDATKMFLNHTRGKDGATVIEEWDLQGTTGSLKASNRRELLVVDQPYPNHNGGDLTWGPDGMLWVGMGDGGDAGDPEGRAQRLDTYLGKILRLDPGRSDLVPADNPYADGGGKPLIWARGVRNPWRISFDRSTNDLWIGDVGQDRWEEIDVLRAAEGTGRGADLEWDRKEGKEDFAEPGPTDGWPDDNAAVVEPLHVYEHGDRCSISGGYVYRGTSLPTLGGWYLYSDYCDAKVRALGQDGADLDLGLVGDKVVSINPDESGEPLVLGASGLSRIGSST